MSAFDIHQITIVRPFGQKGRGTGMRKTPTGGYVKDGDAPIANTDPGGEPALEGSPFPCRYYHKTAQFTESTRDESEVGVATVNVQHVLKVERPGADIRIGDIAILPAGTVYADRPCRALIVLPRIYSDGVQCDIETGAV